MPGPCRPRIVRRHDDITTSPDRDGVNAFWKRDRRELCRIPISAQVIEYRCIKQAIGTLQPRKPVDSDTDLARIDAFNDLRTRRALVGTGKGDRNADRHSVEINCRQGMPSR